MYNLKADPLEQRNLAGQPEYLATQEKLAQELTELLAAEGLTVETDKMPLDLGIKAELPDQKIR